MNDSLALTDSSQSFNKQVLNPRADGLRARAVRCAAFDYAKYMRSCFPSVQQRADNITNLGGMNC